MNRLLIHTIIFLGLCLPVSGQVTRSTMVVSPVWGSITVPDQVEPYTPILAECRGMIPEGLVDVKIRWSIIPLSAEARASLIPVEKAAHVWASPGSFKLMANVVWMSYEEVEVSVGDGTMKKIRNLLAWDVQSYEKTFQVLSPEPEPEPEPGPGPGPDPNPNPPIPPSGFEAQILAALREIGSPPSRVKVGEVYSEVAEKANTRRDVYKPATMVDETKTRVVSTLTPEELQTWGPFWPKLNQAFRDRQMEESDTDAFIKAFRELSTILKR